MAPSAVKGVAKALRSFLRFGEFRGEVAAGLVAAVPAVATWTTTPPMPKAISAEHAQRAIDSCDRSTAIGRRDRAVLLLLARLGLRACEIIRLPLDDVDWDQAHCAFAARAGGRACCRCRPMSARPSPRTCSTAGRPARTGTCSFARWRRSAVCCEGSDGVGSIVRYALRAGQGRRAASGLASVPPCPGRSHAAARRLAARDRRGAAPPQPAVHQHLRQGGSRRSANPGHGLARRCAMNTLREALQEYLELRRGLGYKMHDAGLLLPRFVSFMEEHQRRAHHERGWRWSGRSSRDRCSPPSGRGGCASCAASPAIAAPPTAARRFRRSACCRTARRAPGLPVHRGRDQAAAGCGAATADRLAVDAAAALGVPLPARPAQRDGPAHLRSAEPASSPTWILNRRS